MIPGMQNYIRETARRLPDKLAVHAGATRLTYADLDRLSDGFAAYLQSIGVERGDRVVLCLGNVPEMVVAFWATLKIGAVVSPVGVELQDSKVEYMLRDSGAKVFVTTSDREDDLPGLLAHISSLEHILWYGPEDATPSGAVNIEEAMEGAPEKLVPSSHIDIDLAMIIYTSGSTGEPKGVMHTHRSMLTAGESLGTYLDYREEDKVICALPLSFDYGLYQVILCGRVGATLILEKDVSWPVLFLKKIASEKATILPAVPTLFTLLCTQNKKFGLDVSSIRAVTNTGAALTRKHISEIQESFPNAAIFSMYGLTECKRCTWLPPEDIDRKPGSVGFAIPNTEMWIAGDSGEKLGPNQPGQLVIRGGTVMRGYWQKPDKTAEKLKDGPLPGEKVLYTGDRCMIDEEGYLYFLGRMDQMIKSRGVKVSPKEIEDYLYKLSTVKDAVVLGVPHPEFGEALYAFVRATPGESLTPGELQSYCKSGLENYKVPEWIEVLPSFPLTPNGKFNLLALKERARKQLAVEDGTVVGEADANAIAADSAPPAADVDVDADADADADAAAPDAADSATVDSGAADAALQTDQILTP